ncbi:MAG: hypothetical protein WAV05_00755 [Anaerolineales bacterium]
MPLISNYLTHWIGPFGGTIATIVMDPTDPKVIYAGSFGAGVFKSVNGGITWESSSLGLDNLYICTLAIDPTLPTILYAGTYRSQIYKSEDGGNSWIWSGTGIQDMAIVYYIAIDPFAPSTIFATTRGISNNGGAPWKGVVYRSQDAGQNWDTIMEDVGGANLQDWAYSITVNRNHHNQVYIAAHESGPFRSDNSGDNWYPIQNGIKDYSGRSIVVSPLPDYSSRLYYGVWHDDSIYKSNNTGLLWTLSNQGIPGEKVYTIALDPKNVNYMYLGTFTHGIIKSSDGGISWQNSGLPNDQFYALAINPNTTNDILAGTEGDGLFRSQDAGKTWIRSNAGIQNAQVSSVILSPTLPNTLYASVLGGGVYKSKNEGMNWEEMNRGLTDRNVLNMVMDPAQPNLLYALTSEGGLFKNDLSRDDGWISTGSGLPLTQYKIPAYADGHPFATLEMRESFANSQEGLTPGQVIHASLQTMVFAPSNHQILYLGTGGSGVYRSADGGQSWQPAGLNSQNILALAVDLVNPNLVYAATATPGSLKISTNGGNNWTDLSLGVSFYSLEASPVTAGIVYAGTNSGVYRYQSGKWTALGLSDQLITAIKMDSAQPELIYAGTSLGAYYSLDNGISWKFADDNLRNQIIQSISINPTHSNLVYFCTVTHGIFLAAIHF